MKTRLAEINPPLRPGQRVACNGCGHMVGGRDIRAVVDVPFTYYCVTCKPRTTDQQRERGLERGARFTDETGRDWEGDVS